MDRAQRCHTASTRTPRVTASRFGAVLVLAAVLPSGSRAESALQTAAPGGRAVSASAHLDFRITVLPSLGMSVLPNGVHLQANSGALTLQHDAGGAWDGRPPTGSLQLRPRNQVTDTSLQASAFAGGELITIASP